MFMSRQRQRENYSISFHQTWNISVRPIDAKEGVLYDFGNQVPFWTKNLTKLLLSQTNDFGDIAVLIVLRFPYKMV